MNFALEIERDFKKSKPSSSEVESNSTNQGSRIRISGVHGCRDGIRFIWQVTVFFAFEDCSKKLHLGSFINDVTLSGGSVFVTFCD